MNMHVSMIQTVIYILFTLIMEMFSFPRVSMSIRFTDLILRTTSRIVNCNMIKYRFFDFLIPKFYSNKLAPQLVKSNVRNFVVCSRQILWFTSIKNHLNDCSKKNHYSLYKSVIENMLMENSQ
jgi:predicted AlkP superfamily pyrophosphatase or phosphodiesterase